MNEVTTQGRNARRWFIASLLVIVSDQLSKWYIVESFVYRQRVEVNAFLDITRLHNTGAAFSLLADMGGWQRWFFVALALAVSVLIAVWIMRLRVPQNRTLAAGLALILGGAVGNLIDRLVHGYVVDFIHAHYNDAYWPAFNVADSAITVGAVLLVIDTLLDARRQPKPPEST